MGGNFKNRVLSFSFSFFLLKEKHGVSLAPAVAQVVVVIAFTWRQGGHILPAGKAQRRLSPALPLGGGGGHTR